MPRKSKSMAQSRAQTAMVTMLVAAGRLTQVLEDVCAGFGITADQYNVLRILRGVYPDGHPRFAVAERLINRAPDVTRLLDRLERDHLIIRERSEHDRRLSISRISKRGLDLLAAMDGEVLATHERFAAGLGRAEVSQLAAICAKLASR